MEHKPVLLEECINGLNIKPGGIYVDGTFGRGGHSRQIAARLGSGRLIAIDCDGEAMQKAGELAGGNAGKITFVRGNFRNIAQILDRQGIAKADGMLFDLGVSSPQFDDPGRGFSYTGSAKPDMRMDDTNPLTAHIIINEYSRDELAGIFYNYGEEKYARQIAKAIVNKRNKKTIDTTDELSAIICAAIPPAARREQQHPARRCFQALRIAVGDELEALKEMLSAVPGLLSPGGRICIISFHSLEDRIVKKAFASYARGCVCPRDAPVCICGRKPEMMLITKKPVTAGAAETECNPRARSAKLRIAQKL